MGAPSKLVNAIVSINGVQKTGETTTVKLPNPERDMDEYRNGGMSGPVMWDKGMKALTIEHEYGGLVPREITSGFGATRHDSEMVTFRAAYRNEGTGLVDAVEAVCRGRHQLIDEGDAKVGDDTKKNVKTVLSYYKLSINRIVVYEFDFFNMIEIVDGVDRLADVRAALLLD